MAVTISQLPVFNCPSPSSEFVSRKNERNELTSWTVAILSGELGTPWEIGAQQGDMIQRGLRTRFVSEDTEENVAV